MQKRRIKKFRKRPAGQQLAHVDQATTDVLRSVQGNVNGITMGRVKSIATRLEVPAELILQRLRARGINPRPQA